MAPGHGKGHGTGRDGDAARPGGGAGELAAAPRVRLDDGTHGIVGSGRILDDPRLPIPGPSTIGVSSPLALSC